MTAKNLFELMEALRPSPYTDGHKLLWLNDLESKLWTELLCQPGALWRNRTEEELAYKPLLLPDSAQNLYVSWLWAMAEFAAGEHTLYQNTMAMYNDDLARLAAWYADTYEPAARPAFWTEWHRAEFSAAGETLLFTIPEGCAVLAAECRGGEEAPAFVSLGSPWEADAYLGDTAPGDGVYAHRELRFREVTDREVYAFAHGAGTAFFRLLLQPTAQGAPAAPGTARAAYGAPGPAGADGKSAYAYAVDGGYTGTEADFAAKIAAEFTAPDWGESDPGSAGYIRNRTHYDTLETLLPLAVFAFDGEGMYTDEAWTGQCPAAGDSCTVSWNGTEYVCEAVSVEGLLVLGNQAAVGGGDTGEPFMAMLGEGVLGIVALDGAAEASVGITRTVASTLARRYLPATACIIPVDAGCVTYSGSSLVTVYQPLGAAGLYEHLTRGDPIWLDTTALNDGKELCLQVCTWAAVTSFEEQLASGIDRENLVVQLMAHELRAGVDRVWIFTNAAD